MIRTEKNAQRTDIDEAMGEGGGDEEEDGESEDDNEDAHGTSHTHTTYSLTDAPIHIHFPLCHTHQYIRRLARGTVTVATPHTWSSVTS